MEGDEEQHCSPNFIEPYNNPKKRKSITSTMVVQDKSPFSLSKGAILSLTKPSYVLGLGSKTLRKDNRSRLSYLFTKLMSYHQWSEATGVLSVLLKGTCKDRSMPNNRLKYTALMEIVELLGTDSNNGTRLKNIYDIWIRKTTTLKGKPVENRYLVHIEFIVFCLTQGNIEDAYQAALWLMQENDFGTEPVSNMIVYSPGHTNKLSFTEGWDKADSIQACTEFQCDSNSSINNDQRTHIDLDKGLQIENSVGVHSVQIETLPQNFQSQGFYANSADNTGSGALEPGHSNQMTSTFSDLEGLNSVLLPVKLFNENGVHTEMLNDYYKEAVNCLRRALCSTPPVLAALLPLIQLLLVGGQVDEALNELNKFCCNSNSTLPMRLRATLLEHFEYNNINISSHFEDILNKDPTCCDSLAKLVVMHRNGEYSSESLLEVIASHLDATYADHNTWRDFASCFLKLSQYEEDQMSVCLNENDGGVKQRYSVSLNKTPNLFRESKSRKNWRLRCRWWMTRHFSSNMLASEIAAGDLELITYKAASASHMFGPKFAYVTKAYSCLEEKNEIDFLGTLKLHINSDKKFTPFRATPFPFSPSSLIYLRPELQGMPEEISKEKARLVAIQGLPGPYIKISLCRVFSLSPLGPELNKNRSYLQTKLKARSELGQHPKLPQNSCKLYLSKGSRLSLPGLYWIKLLKAILNASLL
ncbi:hypothetical protein G4B88_016160 [Cannabis sativa]|uniref:Uncharacterized protein n=1 Tax=Cannabis sativa TaxID=3483 RepID=A0A7J6FJG5_CANSA|nr:hypothetical protein G4B88_016160 [Cannabis sativa]